MDNIITLIDDLPSDDFVAKNRGKTLVNQLEAVRHKIEAGNLQGSRSQLEHAILPKTDGCASEGEPDSNDWIDNCEAQGRVRSAITDLISALDN